VPDIVGGMIGEPALNELSGGLAGRIDGVPLARLPRTFAT
jgi:hypothetical protein